MTVFTINFFDSFDVKVKVKLSLPMNLRNFHLHHEVSHQSQSLEHQSILWRVTDIIKVALNIDNKVKHRYCNV